MSQLKYPKRFENFLKMTQIIHRFALKFALICVFVMQGSLELHMDHAFLTASAKVSTHVDQTNIGTFVEVLAKRLIAMMTQIIRCFAREFALTCVFVKKDSLGMRMGSVFPTASALLSLIVGQTNIEIYVEALAKRPIAMTTQIIPCFARECALICVFVMTDSLEMKMGSVFLMASALLPRNVGQTNIGTNVGTLARNQTAMMIQNIPESVLSVSDTFFHFESIQLIF